MHIEVGIIDPARIALANAAALALVAAQLPAIVRNPLVVPKAILAAVGFSAMMQIWHLPVGPSELHLIGATTIYMLFGFAPAMLGFALGLVLQAFLFRAGRHPASRRQRPVPDGADDCRALTASAAACSTRTFATVSASARVLRIDAVYYAGVSAMVGFWLMISNDSFAVADWATWVAAYFPVFVAEAVITFSVVSLIKGLRSNGLVSRMTEVNRLTFA